MADNRIIHSAIRMADGEVYGPGREDELEKVLTKDQFKALTEQGAISGEFKAGAAEPKAEAKTETKTK